MRVPMGKRLVITCFNIIFPPVAVGLLSGIGEDLLISCLLFLCAIIPSHIHGFYISMTYFNRKRKVRKGVYPGPWRRMIFSQRVQNGGASNREIERLRQLERTGGVGREKIGSRVSRTNSRRRNDYPGEPSSPISQTNSGRRNDYQGEPMSPISQTNSRRRSQRYGERQDQGIPSRRSSRRVA